MNRLCTVLPLLLALCLSSYDQANAGTVWDGLSSVSWGDGGNWGGATPAFDGTETLTFPNGFASGTATTLDGDRNVGALSFTATTAFSIDPGAPGTSKIILASGNLTRTGSQNNTISSEVELEANATFNVAGSTTGAAIVSGVISEASPGLTLNKTGSRTLQLTGNNTYTGVTTVTSGVLLLSGTNSTASVTLNGGTLQVGNTNALGAGTLDVNGGTILTTSDLTIPNDVQIDANFTFDGKDHNYTGTATLTGTRQMNVTTDGASDIVTFNNGIAESGGSHGLNLTGSRFIEFLGNNTYTGPTTMSSNVDAIFSGSSNATSSVTTNGTGNSIYLGDDNGLGTGTLTMNGGALRALGARTVNNDVIFNGQITFLASSSKFTFNDQVELNGDTTFVGSQGAGAGVAPTFASGITESGAARSATFQASPSRVFILEGTSNYTGGTTINSGIVTLDGSLSKADITIAAGALLQGNGTIFFTDGDLIDVDGTMTATSMTFDLTNHSPGTHTILDYSTGGAVFNGPGSIEDLLSAASVSEGWSLSDTGSSLIASLPQVPEPSSVSLLAACLLGIALRRRGRGRRGASSTQKM